MKNLRLIFSFLLISFFASAQNRHPDTDMVLRANAKTVKFIENKGQWNKEVTYLSRVNSTNIWFEKNAITFEAYHMTGSFSGEKDEEVTRKGHVWNMKFDGASPTVKLVPTSKLSTYHNYYLGNDSANWASEVQLYNELTYTELYPNIDIRYYGTPEGVMEFDYIVKPGGNLDDVKMSFDGLDSLSIGENGDLNLHTTHLGILKVSHPYTYQTMNSALVQVDVEYYLVDEKTVGLKLKDGQEYNAALALIVDPTYDWSTYISCSDCHDIAFGVDLDASGNVYVTGYTDGANYPTTSGAYDVSHANASSFPWVDVFVSKLSSNGTSLLYSTFIGGSSEERAFAIAVDGSGNAFITGMANSGFPTTSGAYDTSQNGDKDVFVTKFNSTGTALIYSTFIGGSIFDAGYTIDINSSGEALVAGETGVGGFPTTSGAFDVSSGGYEGFVTKLNAAGNGLIWSTYLGGSNGSGFMNAEMVTHAQYLADGSVLTTGQTSSNNFPTTSGAYDQTHNSFADLFVTHLHADGSAAYFSTYIGGNDFEKGGSASVASDGTIYVTGASASTNFPTTSGVIQATDPSSGYVQDAVICKLSSNGSALLKSTYFGANGGLTFGRGIHAATSGPVVVGTTTAALPLTGGPDVTTISSGYDFFLLQLNSDLSSSSYGSFMETSRDDGWNSSVGTFGTSATVYNPATGKLTCTGGSVGNDFPTTSGVYQTVGLNSATSQSSVVVFSFTFDPPVENCNNCIDDDGDGLIDGADPDCPCYDAKSASYGKFGWKVY